MRTEEDSFPIALIHTRTILVGLSFRHLQIFRLIAGKHMSSKEIPQMKISKTRWLYIKFQHLLDKLHLSMTHAVSGFVAQI